MTADLQGKERKKRNKQEKQHGSKPAANLHNRWQDLA